MTVSNLIETVGYTKASAIDDFIIISKEFLNQDTVVYISALLGLMITFSLFYRNVLLKIYENTLLPLFKFFSNLNQLTQKIEVLSEKISKIETEVNNNHAYTQKISEEFKSNGGSSLRDIIDEIKNIIFGVDARIWTIVSNFQGPIWECDKNGNCVRANYALLTLTQRSLEEISGKGWLSFVDENDRERVWKEWESCVAQNRQFEMVYVIKNKSEEKYKVKSKGTPFSDKRGKILGFIRHFEKIEKLP